MFSAAEGALALRAQCWSVQREESSTHCPVPARASPSLSPGIKGFEGSSRGHRGVVEGASRVHRGVHQKGASRGVLGRIKGFEDVTMCVLVEGSSRGVHRGGASRGCVRGACV